MGGCFLHDCQRTDKFFATSIKSCPLVCRSLPGCKFWVWGTEDGQTRCWLRKGDAGRETSNITVGWKSASRECAPEGLEPLVMGTKECWMADFNYNSCCSPSFGASGNPTCWDARWDYD